MNSSDEVTQGPRRFGVAVLAIAVAVGLLLGYAVGWLVPRFTSPSDTSAEAGFARDMISHHSQAVEIGLIAFQQGTNGDVRQVGMDIATAQQGEIGAMQTWLRLWRLGPTGSQQAMAWMPEGPAALENGLMPGMATATQLNALRAAKGKDVDILFCQLMIRHHLGGIHMADGILTKTDEAEVRQLAGTMKAGQTKELTVLQNLLSDLGAKPL